MKSINKPVKYTLIAFAVLIGLGFVYIYYKINPAGQDWMPKCPFHSMTGMHCPGCGSQRAIHDFLHGNIIDGFRHNVLIGLGILVLFYKLVLIIRSKYYPQKKKNLLYDPKTPWVIFIVIVSFWIMRNIPYEPFSFLAP